MTRLWTLSTTALYVSVRRAYSNHWLRFGFLAVYYGAILAAIIVLYGKGDFSTPSFIYQGY